MLFSVDSTTFSACCVLCWQLHWSLCWPLCWPRVGHFYWLYLAFVLTNVPATAIVLSIVLAIVLDIVLATCWPFSIVLASIWPRTSQYLAVLLAIAIIFCAGQYLAAVQRSRAVSSRGSRCTAKTKFLNSKGRSHPSPHGRGEYLME